MDFNTPLTSMDTSLRQKINKETMVLNDILDHIDLIYIFRAFHPKATEYTFFPQVHMEPALFTIDKIWKQPKWSSMDNWIKKSGRALTGWFGWLEHCLVNQEVTFVVRAHTQVVGLIPGWGVYGRQPVNVSLSQWCFSLSLKSTEHISSGKN